jgi:hypothetical protein
MTIEGKSVSMRGALPTAARSWPLSGRGLLGGLREDAGTGVAGSGDGGGGGGAREGPSTFFDENISGF